MTTIDDIQIFLMTHNRADLISESLESLLSQTAGVKEITVLDNESTDNTEEVVSSFFQRGVKYQKTVGFLGNFNFAHENADKKYVMLFHDDDILHPEYLEKVLEILNKEKKIAAVYSRYTEFWNKNSPKSLSEIKTTIQNGGGYYLFKDSKEFAIFMYFQEVIAYATAVYKTDFFKQIPIEYEKFSKFNDWPFMVKFGKYGKIALLADGNAFHIRRHSGQDTWTSTNTPSFEQILNWDKFFFDVFFAKKDRFLRKIYSRKAIYFYTGKYDAFTTQEQKSKLSKTEFQKMAREHGLCESNEYLVSKETYDAWLSYFCEKRHKGLSGKKNSFLHLTRLWLRFVKRYLKNKLEKREAIQKVYVLGQENKQEKTMLKDKLEIFIITYNREKYLKHTLEQVYSKKSPIRDFKITILDNKSTDGSAELIDNAIADFPNSKHVIHNRNIGGNGNIARCYELASMEYFWILCDDDEINFGNWAGVEKAILEESADCVVVSNYIHPKESVAQLLGQLSFVPAGIYKTENLTDTVMQNISFQISCYFPQLALVCKLINDNKKFVILDDWIVQMVEHPAVASYSRGMDKDKHPLMANMTWSLGFMKTIQMIKDEETRELIIEQYHNENGIYMLHPNTFLNENIKCANSSFSNQQEFYCLLPNRLKLLYSYGSSSGLFSNELTEKINGLQAELVRESLTYRTGKIFLFIPKTVLKIFRKILHICRGGCKHLHEFYQNRKSFICKIESHSSRYRFTGNFALDLFYSEKNVGKTIPSAEFSFAGGIYA